ncbi:MAG: ribosomal RNA small subunit methyltransferase A [Polyangiaceae bacterium]|nr:ribosomal RNA small subunit methyltransferase A [Polyangiaceae bacterium]
MIRAKKSFGQHFLADQRACERIAELSTTPPGGAVVEIGPGTGALTRHLVARAARVIALERDRELVPVLARAFSAELARGQLTLRETDAARHPWLDELADAPRPRVIAGNVPYNITGRLLERATEVAPHVDRVVFLVQREVAERLISPPDGDDYGALSVFVQAAFSVELPLRLGPGAFRPPPKVDSAVVVLTPHATPRAEETPVFRELVKAAFGQRRKTLRNAWSSVLPRADLALVATRAGVDLERRGETLSVEDFARVASLVDQARASLTAR